MRGARTAPNGLVLLLLLCRGGATNGTGHDNWLYAKADGSVPNQVVQEQTWDDGTAQTWECSHDHTQSPIDVVTAEALPDASLVDAIEPSIDPNYVRPTTTKHGFQLFHTLNNVWKFRRGGASPGSCLSWLLPLQAHASPGSCLSWLLPLQAHGGATHSRRTAKTRTAQ